MQKLFLLSLLISQRQIWVKTGIFILTTKLSPSSFLKFLDHLLSIHKKKKWEASAEMHQQNNSSLFKLHQNPYSCPLLPSKNPTFKTLPDSDTERSAQFRLLIIWHASETQLQVSLWKFIPITLFYFSVWILAVFITPDQLTGIDGGD